MVTLETEKMEDEEGDWGEEQDRKAVGLEILLFLPQKKNIGDANVLTFMLHYY